VDVMTVTVVVCVAPYHTWVSVCLCVCGCSSVLKRPDRFGNPGVCTAGSNRLVLAIPASLAIERTMDNASLERKSGLFILDLC
jgi:hypothetical protein